MEALARSLVHAVPALSGVPLWTLTTLIMVAASAVVLAFTLTYAGLASYALRKVAGDIQARIGPNRVGPYGLFQFIADGVKLLLKEDLIPAKADRFLFRLAPYFVFIGCFGAFVVVPFGVGLIAADLNIGIYYVLAVTSLVVVGVMLAGWSSNNKWALLGGMRAAAQIVSYEVPVGMALMPAILVAGSLSLQDMVRSQGGLLGIFGWNLFHNPFTFAAFFLYFTAGLAETNQTPFDLPEAESELVSGYNVEYSGIRFALFFLAEFGDMFIVAALATACFLGGWQVPFVNVEALPALWGNLLSFGAFLVKTLLMVLLMFWVRWTLPRLRVDQLMRMSWKYLVPLTFANLLGVSLWLLVFDGKGIPQLIASVAGMK
jgi:NADH-quinone oxidoreductase subunit H